MKSLLDVVTKLILFFIGLGLLYVGMFITLVINTVLFIAFGWVVILAQVVLLGIIIYKMRGH